MSSPIYAPLPSPRAIRILIVQPSSLSDAPIECELKTIDIDDDKNPSSYKALSYVWGEHNETSPSKILVHGHEHIVTPNLEAALRHLRRDDKPLLLWVDAVCINQNDLSERRSQVEIMADIYKRAVTTVSWLGEGDADSDEAVELVRAMGNWMIEHRAELDDHVEDEHDTRTLVQVIEDLGFSLRDRKWSPVWRLLERPYWSRVWIIQELAARGDFLMGADGVFHCGSKSFERFQLDCFCSVVLYCIQAGPASNFVRASSGNTAQDPVFEMHEPVASLQGRMQPLGIRMAQTLMACRGIRFNRHRHIDWLLRLTRRFRATDPRDKLYALRGLVIDSELVIPNYSKSFEEVVEDFSINHIRLHSSLQILLGNRFREHFPSWTVEILADDHLTAPGLAPGADTPYRAADDRDAVITYERLSHSLSCRGVVVGSIIKVIGPLVVAEGPGAEDVFGDHVSLGQDKVFSSLQQFYRGLGDEISREIFWRTLCLDTDSSDPDSRSSDPAPAPASYATQFYVMFGLHGGTAVIPETFLPGEDTLRRYSAFIAPFYKGFNETLASRTFITTKNEQVHRMGIGPYLAKEGDVVAVLFGANLCLVLRPVEGDNRYKVMGDAYIHGIMNGELVKDVLDDGGQVFDIV